MGLDVFIHEANPYYPTVEKQAGKGPMVITGRGTLIWCQRQGDGHYRLGLFSRKPEDFATNGAVDLANTEAVKELMLQDEYLGAHDAEFKAMIQACEGPIHPWPLYYMPPEFLSWESAPGVTLIGDAAHTTTPFAGDGVNCAMLDSIILSEKLKEFGMPRVQEAIQEYEKKMFPYAADVIRRSNANSELFFDWNAPYTLRDAGILTPGGRTALSENL
jgi:2-polyprenyl-6-methoxyphenol hydroxylase-like FAD-dependent oxidoreductase